MQAYALACAGDQDACWPVMESLVRVRPGNLNRGTSGKRVKELPNLINLYQWQIYVQYLKIFRLQFAGLIA